MEDLIENSKITIKSQSIETWQNQEPALACRRLRISFIPCAGGFPAPF
jgi:hypothetical protein